MKNLQGKIFAFSIALNIVAFIATIVLSPIVLNRNPTTTSVVSPEIKVNTNKVIPERIVVLEDGEMKHNSYLIIKDTVTGKEIISFYRGGAVVLKN